MAAVPVPGWVASRSMVAPDSQHGFLSRFASNLLAIIPPPYARPVLPGNEITLSVSLSLHD